MSDYKYLILGGGITAGYAAQAFSQQDIEAGELAIVSADEMLPYERPPLSKAFLLDEKPAEKLYINPPEFYEEQGITVLLESPITEVDLSAKKLQTRQGETLGFEKLLIATGSQLNQFEDSFSGLYYLRGLDDARQIKAAYQSEHVEKVGIIGGGYIGMEVAAALNQKGLAVTMIFPEERLMQRLFTAPMSEFFADYYRNQGIEILSETEIAAFHGAESISEIELTSGDSVPVDFVVAGIGVSPATDLFRDTALQLDNGIVVNEYLESNLSDIYAAGDVANFYDATLNKQRRLEHWANAAAQGQHVAQVMTGNRQPFEQLSFFYSDVFDLSWEFWGEATDADEVIHRGQVAEGEFSAWWLRDGVLIGTFLLNRPSEERTLAQQWLQQQRTVDPERLADDSQPLAEDS